MIRADLRRSLAVAMTLCLVTIGTMMTPRVAGAFPVAGKPVMLILPAIGGSTGDRVLRLFADKLKDDWKVPVIVDAKPGAGGAIGTEFVARAAPDGHTILLGFSHLVQAPAFDLKRPYDTFRDFIPVARITDLPMMLLTADAGTRSLKDFVGKAQASPGKFTYGSYGNATTSHIYSELINQANNLGEAHTPYRGTPPMIVDLIAGHLNSAVIDLGNTMSYIKAGKLFPLAITGTRRSRLAPDVPTFQEAGYPDIVVPGRYWLLLPAGVPPATVELIRSSVERVLKMPDVQEQFLSMGLEPASGEREDVGADMRADLEYWRRVAKKTGIKAYD